MNELLSHPAVQAGLAPFLVAVAIGLLLLRSRFLVVAVASGPVVVLALTIGFSLEPFTSVRKLMLTSFACAALCVAVEAKAAGRQTRTSPVAGGAWSILAGGAAVWTMSRVLQQMELPAAGLAALAAFVFVFAVTGASLFVGAASSLRGAVTGTALGWGAGVLALLGASALLAQIGLAVGSACAAIALLQLLRGREAPLGGTLVVPAAVTAGVVGVLASATGELRWWCLIPLPFVPLFVHLAARWRPVESGSMQSMQSMESPWHLRRRVLLTGFAAVLPAAAAIGLAWWAAAFPSLGH